MQHKDCPGAKLSPDSGAARLHGGLRVAAVVGVLLAVAHVVMVRLCWRSIPLQTDTGMWAYIGGRILDGALPYRDLWESKPPAIYYLFAFVEWCLGNQALEGFVWLDAFVSVAVFAATYRLARAVAPRWAAAIALVPLSLVFSHRVLSDWGDNLEKFVALLDLTGLLILLPALRTSGDGRGNRVWWRWLAAGCCCAAATMFKQTGLALPLATSVFWIGGRVRKSATRASFSGVDIGCLWLGFVTGWAPVVFYLRSKGMLAAFVDQAVLYDLFRAGGGSGEGSRLVMAEHWQAVFGVVRDALILIGPAIVGAVTLFRLSRTGEKTRNNSVIGVVGVYALVAVLPLMLAPHGYGHYFLQAAPACCVLVACQLGWIRDRIAGRAGRWMTLAVVVAGLYFLADHFEFVIRGDTANGAYAAQTDRMREMVQVIVEHSEKGSPVMVWPPDYAASYYADRRTPLESSNSDVIFKGKYYRLSPSIEVILQRLKSDPPPVIVDSTRARVVTPGSGSTGAGEGPVLQVEPAVSLWEPPNPESPFPEGRLLVPLKTWLMAAYGGQRRVGRFTIFYLGEPWREWQEAFSRDRE